MRRKTRPRFRGLPLGAMLLATALIAASCGGDDDDSASTTETTGGEIASLTIGAKDFPSAQLISQLYGQVLASAGVDVSYEDLGPTEVTFAALEAGEIDLYGEYQGTLLTFLEGTPTADAEETNQALADALEPKGIVASSPSDAVDVNGFYVTTQTADEYGLETVSDLTDVAGELTFGGPPECSERPLCLGATSQELYGLQFKEVKKLDVGGPITVQALEDGDIQVGLLFTGSSTISDDFVLLEDDQGLQPADNVIAVWSEDVSSDAAQEAIDSVNSALDTEAYNEMSLQISEQKLDPADVAEQWLSDQGLI